MSIVTANNNHSNNNESASNNAISSSTYYRDLLNSVSTYNKKLSMERKARYPYIDGQTGIIQNPSRHLYFDRSDRHPGERHDQLYTYKTTDWLIEYPIDTILDMGLRTDCYKKILPSNSHNNTHDNNNNNVNNNNNNNNSSNNNNNNLLLNNSNNLRLPAITTTNNNNNNISRRPVELGKRKYTEDAYDHSDHDESIQDTASYRDSEPDNSTDDDDVHIHKKSGGRSHNRGAKSNKFTIGRNNNNNNNNNNSNNNNERKYKCTHCPKAYKHTRELKTHFTKEHAPKSSPDILTSINSPRLDIKVLKDIEAKAAQSSNKDIKVKPKGFCDFCTNNELQTRNKREKLISCADCGRSAHPTCLKFGPRLSQTVLTYRWQCMECKECIWCGKADNDDRLLFCDYCDRGFHIYCLKPPMQSPPDGPWICAMCQSNDDNSL